MLFKSKAVEYSSKKKKTQKDDTVYQVPLFEASHGKYFGKNVEMNVIVAG
jgi:hypothetical protein